MKVRATLFALALLVSGALVTYGIALLSIPLSLVAAGVLIAAWAWIVLSE